MSKINTLEKFESPQLKKIHAGKVRDSIRIDGKKRMIVVTDRISAFNKNLEYSAIPYKGAVLNTLTNFWFKKTKHIINNHFIEQIDDNISIVKECQPIRVEMIVRAYLTGSMWRGYQKGQRVFSGAIVPGGLASNQKFPKPILTPTTVSLLTTLPLTIISPLDISAGSHSSNELINVLNSFVFSSVLYS